MFAPRNPRATGTRHVAIRPHEAGGITRSTNGTNALGSGATAQRESPRRQLQPGGISESSEVWRAGSCAAIHSGPRECAFPAVRADSPQHVYLRTSSIVGDAGT